MDGIVTGHAMARADGLPADGRPAPKGQARPAGTGPAAGESGDVRDSLVSAGDLPDGLVSADDHWDDLVAADDLPDGLVVADRKGKVTVSCGSKQDHAYVLLHAAKFAMSHGCTVTVIKK